MENNFDLVMSKKTNQELIVIITADRSKYQHSAIISAEKEVEKRGIDVFSNLTNEELILIHTTDRFNYKKKFIDSALIEFENRNLEKSIIENYKSNYRQLLNKEEGKKDASDDMIYGLFWCIGGIALTMANIGYIFYGAILYGGIQFIKGAYNYISLDSKN
jgi:hypothetical protein